MPLPIVAAAYLDGVRIADTAAEYGAGTTTALAGASVSWGRSTTMDQPDTSSATVRLVRRGAAAAGFLNTLRTGHRLDITATGAVYPDPTVSTFLDPGFNNPTAPHTAENAITYPGLALLRTNLTTRPIASRQGAPWHVLPGDGETALSVPVQTPGAGPQGRTGYIHWTVTAAKTGGDSGPYYSDAVGVSPAGGSGDVLSGGMWVRLSVARTITPTMELRRMSSGVIVVTTTKSGTPVALAANVWTYVQVDGITATGPYDAVRVWARLPATVVQPVGASIDYTNALIVRGPVAGTYFDGSFADNLTFDYSWAGAVNGSASTESTAPAPTGKFTYRPANPARAAFIELAPAPFAAPGATPDAWDAIPAGSVGQRWSFGATVTAPTGTTVRLRPVLYSGPYPDAGQRYTAPSVTVPSDGLPHAVSGTFVMPTDGQWLGLVVNSDQASGLGAWESQSPSLVWSGAVGSWDSGQTVTVDDVRVLAPGAGTARTVLVFSGRITDLSAAFDTDGGEGSIGIDLTAQDFPADLNNIKIGDAPWLVERLDTRIKRILTLAGTGITAAIDPSIAPTLVTYRDVDAQAATGLITELAASVDGVAWSATHQVSGPYWRIEDPAQRPALMHLVEDSNGTISVEFDTDIPGALHLSACDLLLDPVRWVQDVSDVATRIDVSWLEQGVDADLKPTTTDRHVIIVEPDLETVMGQRGVSLSTQLQSGVDALTVGTKLMARASVQGWRLEGITWATRYSTGENPVDLANALDLLDGTIRIGLPVVVGELPTWAPRGPEVGSYVEGGTYTVDETGAWVIDLTVSATIGGVGSSVSWSAVPVGWRWDEFGPEISWLDLRGVGIG